MISYDFVSDVQRVCSFDNCFIQKKFGKAFIKAFPHYLINKPHDIEKSACHNIIFLINAELISIFLRFIRFIPNRQICQLIHNKLLFLLLSISKYILYVNNRY